MSLPIKKIYVDTKYKARSSISNSNFKIELPMSITLTENTVFYIDDVSIPHSWHVIEAGVNDRLFIYTEEIGNPGNNLYHLVPIDAGNYSATDLANHINSRINIVVNLPNFDNIYTVTYEKQSNTMKFENQHSEVHFKVLTPDDLKTATIHNAYSNSYDINNPQDINEILGNVEGVSPFYQFPGNYTSKAVNLQTIRNIYIHSSLGNYNTIGPRGESSIVKKVPVSANKGDMIFDQVLSGNDFGDCSHQTLRTIIFELKDSRGNYINFHGSNLSFSIIFSKMNASM
jgi:hypothetical protein